MWRAAYNGEAAMVKLLLEAGGDPAIPTTDFERPFDVAKDDATLVVAELVAHAPESAKGVLLSSAQVLLAFANAPEVRGKMVQQGGFKAAVALSEAGGDRSEKCRIFAGHAAAKILVTTDPNRLTDAQRLAGIAPLLWLCKRLKASDLAHFEALLGLTNLLSLGDTARRRVATAVSRS